MLVYLFHVAFTELWRRDPFLGILIEKIWLEADLGISCKEGEAGATPGLDVRVRGRRKSAPAHALRGRGVAQFFRGRGTVFQRAWHHTGGRGLRPRLRQLCDLTCFDSCMKSRPLTAVGKTQNCPLMGPHLRKKGFIMCTWVSSNPSCFPASF